MNNHRGKDDNDNNSPTGIAALSFIRSVRRRLNFFGDNNEDSDEGKTNDRNVVYNQEVNSNDDTCDDGKTNNDQKNYSPSERLYDLCSRYKFMTKNNTII